jgi:hypothetical protein
MPLDPDPIETFSVVIQEVEKRRLAYVCLTHPRTDMFLPELAKLSLLAKASDEMDIKVSKTEISLIHFTSSKCLCGSVRDTHPYMEIQILIF